MNAKTVSLSQSILSGRKLSQVRVGWWVLFIVYTTFTVFSNWYYLVLFDQGGLESIPLTYIVVISIITNVISWCLAITLFLRKSNEWVIILVSVMFFSNVSARPFWLWIFSDGWRNMFAMGFSAIEISQIMAQPFDIVVTIVSIGVFLTFPMGQWISPKAKQLFWTNIIFLIVINLFLITIRIVRFRSAYQPIHIIIGDFGSLIEGIGTTFFRLLAGYMLFIHYRNMQNSIERQQIKWIVVFFVGSVCVSAIVAIFYFPLRMAFFLHQHEILYDFFTTYGSWVSLPSRIISLGLVVSFSIATFRYRLWDVELLINKALVYSGLTAILGGLVFVSVTLINYAIKQWLGEDESSIWAVLLTTLPVATLFTPIRECLQKWVDRYFKPEEVNFSNTFIEFAPEIREMLTTSEIVQTISEQVKKQLNVDFARVYLLEQDSNLNYAETNPIPEEDNRLSLENKLLTKLRDGKVVVDSDDIPYSLLVPLVVPRARIPDFLGVIVLGRRLEGKGYSTQILDNLKSLGADAGKAIYLSRLSEQAKQNPVE